jgi:hypothetical protein
MSNKIDIKRSYFNSDEYGRIIDNSFRELSTSRTGSISNFIENFITELPFMPTGALDLFVSESKDLSSITDGQYEVERLNSIINDSLERQERNQRNDANEHPIIPNGSFFRTGGQVIKDNKITLRKGIFYYVQEGYLRRIDSAETFIQLFKAKVNNTPYDKATFKNNVPYVDSSFLSSFPQGVILDKTALSKEEAETDIRTSNAFTSDSGGADDSGGGNNNEGSGPVGSVPDRPDQR